MTDSPTTTTTFHSSKQVVLSALQKLNPSYSYPNNLPSWLSLNLTVADTVNNEYWIDCSTYSVAAGPPVSVDIEFRTYCDNNNIYVENQTGFTINFAYLILKDPFA